MLFENRLPRNSKEASHEPLSIENVDKEVLKCKDESLGWGHIEDEHRRP